MVTARVILSVAWDLKRRITQATLLKLATSRAGFPPTSRLIPNGISAATSMCGAAWNLVSQWMPKITFSRWDIAKDAARYRRYRSPFRLHDRPA